MEIRDIEGKTVKVGKTSITVKDDQGKTRGVVNGICKFNDLQPNKQVTYWPKLKEVGIWGSRIDGIMDCVIVADGDLYYLNNTKPLRFYEECLAGNGWDTEEKRYNQRLEIAANAAKHMTVINCSVQQ